MTIGWHVHGDIRRPVLYFFRFAGGLQVQAHTAGDGSIVLLVDSPPSDYDMDEYGRFEFRTLDVADHFADIANEAIIGVDRISWLGDEIGLSLRVGDTGLLVLTNEGDEVFVGTDDLPPEYERERIG